MNLSDDILNIPHENDSRSKVDYRLAWARTRLKLAGYIENSSRGVWTLITPNADAERITSALVDRKSEAVLRARHENEIREIEENHENEEISSWKDKLREKLLTIPSEAFERLAQRILRESGFIQVKVTGRTGDGGIDGTGIFRLNRFLSFRIVFQCKKYANSVAPNPIRDFRGAMQGRADKGLFITTGTFTRDAVKEATRDGAPAIDLVDGEQLCFHLKELGLGIKTDVRENIVIDRVWFNNL